MAAIAARRPAMCRSWALQGSPVLGRRSAAMTAFAQRALDSAVRPCFRAFGPSRCACRLPAASRPAGGGGLARLGQVSASQPAQVPATASSAASSVGRDPQPGRDRGTRRPGHGLHPAPLPQQHRRHRARASGGRSATPAPLLKRGVARAGGCFPAGVVRGLLPGGPQPELARAPHSGVRPQRWGRMKPKPASLRPPAWLHPGT